jgi:hypothetical protein
LPAQKYYLTNEVKKMSEWEIKHLQNRLENQEKRLQKLERKTQDRYFKAIMWLMLLSYAVFFSFVALHDHRRDIGLIQANQEQHSIKSLDTNKKTE